MRVTRQHIHVKNKSIFVGTGSFEEEYDNWKFCVVRVYFLGILVRELKYHSKPIYTTVPNPLPLVSTNADDMMRRLSNTKRVIVYPLYKRYANNRTFI